MMTSSTHSFAYSYRLVKKCFVKICETSKCHNFLIFQPIFIRFSRLCLKFFTLSSEIKLNLLWSSSLKGCFCQKGEKCDEIAKGHFSKITNSKHSIAIHSISKAVTAVLSIVRTELRAREASSFCDLEK